MKLCFISQAANTNYDTYDSAVVAAETEEQTQMTHPSGDDYFPKKDAWFSSGNYKSGDWAHGLLQVKVTLIGEAVDGTPPGPVCASFNAG